MSALPPLMQAYLDHLVLRGRAPSARTVGQSLTQFAGWCVEAGVEPIRATRAQLDDYLTWLATIYRTPVGKPLAKSTVSTRVANVTAWYRWLEVRGEVLTNPAAHLRVRVPMSRTVHREHLTLQEATALVQTQATMVASAPDGTRTHAIQLRNLALISLALATGRRIGGLVGLHAAHIDCDRGELRVEREKGRTGRVLPIADWGTSVAKAYIQQARPLLVLGDAVPWLFPGNDGTGHITPSRLDEMLGQMVSQTIGLNPDLDELSAKTITWHSLRVSFATLLFSNGCPIRSVNELMLHACLSTTARYTPIPIEDMHRVWRSAHPRP